MHEELFTVGTGTNKLPHSARNLALLNEVEAET